MCPLNISKMCQNWKKEPAKWADLQKSLVFCETISFGARKSLLKA